jgi:hypothetical protein
VVGELPGLPELVVACWNLEPMEEAMSEPERTQKSERREPGPRVVRVTPEGRREVDPMSIVGSSAAKEHLKDIAKIITTERKANT